MNRAFLLKEIKANAGLTAITLVLCSAFVAVQFITDADAEASSLFDSSYRSIEGLVPLVAFLAAYRLFMSEYRERTIEMLLGLPVSLGHVAVLKMMIGLFVLLSPCLALIALASWLLQSIEDLDSRLISMAALQTSVYVAAWFGTAALWAQLGRLRTPFLVLVLGSILFRDQVGHELIPVFNAFAVPFSTARFSAPWVGISFGFVWGLTTLTAAAVLFSAHGGAWVRILQEIRSGGLALTLVLLSLLLVYQKNWVGSSNSEAPRGFTVRPAEDSDARLAELSLFVNKARTQLAKQFNLEPLGPLVLMSSSSSTAFDCEMAIHEGYPAISVGSATPLQEVLRQSLDFLLSQRDFDEGRPERAWLRRGLASTYANQTATTETKRWMRRVAHAASIMDISADTFRRDWASVERRLGEEIAAAVAWQGYEVISDVCGPQRISSCIELSFKRRGSEFDVVRKWNAFWSARGLDCLSCGLDSSDFEAKLKDRIEAAKAETAQAIHPGPRGESTNEARHHHYAAEWLRTVHITRAGDGAPQFSIFAGRKVPSHAAFWLSPVPELRRFDSTSSDLQTYEIEDVRLGVTHHLGELSNKTVAVSVAVWSSFLGSWMISGWQVLEPK